MGDMEAPDIDTITRHNLNQTDVRLLTALARNASPDGTCTTSTAALAKLIHRTPLTIINSRKRLEAKGLITVTNNRTTGKGSGGDQPNTYTLNTETE